MRVGQNPARHIEDVPQPAPLTVTIVNFIPYLSGYYEQSLDVLKACLQSINENTPQPFDLFVFDNHSCPEVRDALLDMHKNGEIQYLVLSEQNIGKMGAWNFMFGAAQGEYIAFADSDVYFRAGWWEASKALIDAFPNVGMVTARPLRVSTKFSPATLAWGETEGNLEKGAFQSWETYWEHAISLGLSDVKAREEFTETADYRVSQAGEQAYVGAAHFQFVSPRAALKEVLPIPSTQPMRGDRELDIAIDKKGYLRLTTLESLVRHMGNRLPEDISLSAPKTDAPPPFLRRLLWLPGIRHFLLWVHNQIFRLYFFNTD
jgi:glycosyltransferase involved in cell wall biosynthesis